MVVSIFVIVLIKTVPVSHPDRTNGGTLARTVAARGCATTSRSAPTAAALTASDSNPRTSQITTTRQMEDLKSTESWELVIELFWQKQKAILGYHL